MPPTDTQLPKLSKKELTRAVELLKDCCVSLSERLSACENYAESQDSRLSKISKLETSLIRIESLEDNVDDLKLEPRYSMLLSALDTFSKSQERLNSIIDRFSLIEEKISNIEARERLRK